MSEFFKEIYRLYNKYFLRKPLIQRVILGVLTYCIILAIILLSVIPPQIDLTVGQASNRTIYAPNNIEDKIATEKAKLQAEQSVPDAYVRDRNLEKQVISNLEQISETLFENKSLTVEEIKNALKNNLSSNLVSKLKRFSDNTLYFISKLEDDELASLNAEAKKLILKVFEEGVGSTESGLALIQHEISLLEISFSGKIYIENLLTAVYQPSYSYSEVLTNVLKKEARQNIAPVIIHKGDVIVFKEQLINDHTYSLLEYSGLLSTGRRTQMIVGVALYLLIVFIVGISFLKVFCKEIYDKEITLVMYTLIMVISVLASALLLKLSPLLVISVTVGVLITVLLNWQGAIVAVLVHNAIIAPLIADYPITLVISIVGGITAIISSYKMSQRADMVRIALYVAAVEGALVASMQLLFGNGFGQIAESALIAVFSGVAFVIIAIGSLPLLENTFGIISTVRLLELSNPNRPLLRRLLLEAPGTYNHSIVMGNLAEAAAEAVGGDPLLARVGAYYHDIGKLKRPAFFVENQLDEDNPHNKYTPSLSALIIISHIKDGVELAKEERLPQPVIDMIEQHHGTTLVSYFHHQALEQKTADDTVREVDYRYDGPRPQTKEAGILMLSDAIEAAVRALKRRSATKVEEVVRKIIRARLRDGELDECDLTMRDLEKLAETYIRALSGVYHNRIAYPERSIADLERSKKLGRNSN